MIKIAFVMSRVLPAHVPFFNALAAYSRSIKLDLLVCSAKRQSLPEPFRFNDKVGYQILRGFELKLSSQTLFSYFVTPDIWNILTDRNYDLVVVGGYHIFATQMAMLWSKLRGVPYLLYSESHLHRSKRNRFREFLKGKFLSPIIRGASGHISLGTWATEYLRHYGASATSIFEIPHLPDAKIFYVDEKQKKSLLRKKLGIRNVFTILYVGRMAKIKGVSLLIDGFAKMAESGVVAQLQLIGDGPDLKEFEAQAEKYALENLHFLGAKSSVELADYYGASDLFVMPSIDEPFGAVLVEAIFCGLPVIATDRVASAVDFVVPNENGEIVSSTDISALTSAMTKFMLDENLCERFSNRSKEVAKNWSVDRNVETFISLLRKVFENDFSSI